MIPNSTEENTLPRSNNFDFLRVALAVLVIWGHSSALLSGNERADILHRITDGQIDSGRLAVVSFFLISGFLISQSWERSRNIKDYFLKRVRRIYPGFVVASLLTAVVFAPLGAESAGEYWQNFSPLRFVFTVLTLRMPGLPPVFLYLPFHSANGSLWTIQPEFLCYILLAVLGVVGVLRHRRWIVLFSVGVLLLHWLNSVQPMEWTRHPLVPWLTSLKVWLPNLVYFCAGMVAAQFLKRRVADRTALAALIVTVIAGQIPNGIMFALPFTLPILLLWTAYTPRLKMQNWSERNNDLSYGIYLYAFPIQQCLIKYVPWVRHTALLFFAALLLTVPCAVLSWRWVEAPFLRRRAAKADDGVKHS